MFRVFVRGDSNKYTKRIIHKKKQEGPEALSRSPE